MEYFQTCTCTCMYCTCTCKIESSSTTEYIWQLFYMYLYMYTLYWRRVCCYIHVLFYFLIVLGSFRKLVDINFVCSMGPPGGGRNPLTPRLSRHCNYLSFTELEENSQYGIFSVILKSWMSSFEDSANLFPLIVRSTISVYNTITTEVSCLPLYLCLSVSLSLCLSVPFPLLLLVHCFFIVQ